MHCIGDECPGPGQKLPGPVKPPARGRLLRGLALGVLCAALGNLAAREAPAPAHAAHLAILAPPLVIVSRLAEQTPSIRAPH